MKEGEIIDNGLRFHGWFRWLIGIILTGVISLNAYAFTVVFPRITDNMIVNDKDSRKRDEEIRTIAMENRISIAELRAMNIKLDAIKDDMDEFKGLLRRAAPYELKDK